MQFPQSQMHYLNTLVKYYLLLEVFPNYTESIHHLLHCVLSVQEYATVEFITIYHMHS